MTTWLRGLWLRLRFYLFRDRYDREMEEEMRFHLDLREADHRHGGMSAEDARDAAQQRFGNRASLQELRRTAVAFPSLDALGQDLRYVLRAIRHAPGFSVMVVLTLGLGLGANAAMFGIIDRLLLRGPAHVVDADRVVRLYATEKESDGTESTRGTLGYVLYTHLRDNARDFEDLAVVSRTEATVGRGAEAHRVMIGRASWNLFPLLGVKPVLGRFFSADEDRPPQGENVVVLEEGYWKRVFAGDRAIAGKTMVMGGVTYTIVGVVPQGFTGVQLERRDAWVPISLTYWGPGARWATAWDVNWLQIVGRLKPGVTPEEAAARATIVHHRSFDGPASNAMGTATLTVAPLRYNGSRRETTEARVSRWLVAVAVIVLLIACANVANLFLARAARRRREVAVRLALGVGRGRLIRLLVAESLVLGVAGGVAGLAIAFAGGRFVRGVLLPNVAWTDAGVDLRVFAVTAFAAIITGIVVGLAPAIQGTRLELASALKSGAREGGAARSRLRTTLTVMQAALSVVLLVGAGLFVRSLWRVTSLELGLEPRRILLVSFDWPTVAGQSQEARQRERLRQHAFYEEALARVRSLPGVQRAAVVVGTPFQSSMSLERLRVPGRDSLPMVPGNEPLIRAVSDDYFETAGTRVVRGRAFTAADVATSQRVVVVNETMARTIWPNRDPIGECLLMDTMPCSHVIGVVEDSRRFGLREEPGMQYYIPLGQEFGLGFGGRRLFVRPSGDPVALVQTIRAEMVRLAPGIGFVTVQRMQDDVDSQLRPWRLGATMFAVFGGLAMLVAAIGLYSVISYLVTQRRHEIAVRIAIGADASNIVGLVVRHGVVLALVGLAIGIVIALNGSRWVGPLLFETSPRDPVVYGLVIAVLLAVALLATAVPAWRASRTDPIEALRSD
jgi:predicted permease